MLQNLSEQIKLIINETKFKQYNQTSVIEMKEAIKTKVYKQGLLPLYICDVSTDYPITPELIVQTKRSGCAWPVNA